jgi:queuine tRNA-ribosyltransferase
MKNIKTKHGSIKSPVFLPDATRGYIKTLSNSDLEKLKMGPMVVNTYHLYLQPGLKKIKKSGGIHNFMGWKGPLLSDSGGFQIFSLIHQNPQMGKITDKQVIFKSPFDGAKHVLTPEKSIQIQFDLGTDMIVCLDDCPPIDSKKADLEKAIDRTIIWAGRCAVEYDKRVKSQKSKVKSYKRPLVFAVIQGGTDLKLRKKCFEGLQRVAPASGWDGFGYGARPVDAKGNFLEEVLKYTANLIPEDKIRFALGVGTPEDIVRCARMGWDMFDCVIPTREGRHGRLFFWKRNSKFQIPNSKFYDTINIVNSKFSQDFLAINKDSKLEELREHSKAYLHHLFKLKEPLGQRLATLNNLEFYLDLMERLRK